MFPSKKRSADLDPQDSHSAPKRLRGQSTLRAENPSKAVAWVKLPPRLTVLYGTYLDSPSPASKTAIFDLDGTLIRTKSGSTFARDANDWQWWSPIVPTTLARLAREDGYHIVILSNQAGLTTEKRRREWQLKVDHIARELGDVPFTVIAATAKDGFRKPMTRMWNLLQSQCGRRIDTLDSFFVGDAAGRPGDHSDCDRKFAINLDIPFKTPEEFFLHAPKSSHQLKGYCPGPESIALNATSSAWECSDHAQLVIFVGRPKSGKTYWYTRHLKPLGYVRITTDLELLQVGKLLKVGSKVVIDRQNETITLRRKFIELANIANADLICVHFQASKALAWHNNIFQAYQSNSATQKPVPMGSFLSFDSKFQIPTLSEGFKKIIKIDFLFNGSIFECNLWTQWLVDE